MISSKYLIARTLNNINYIHIQKSPFRDVISRTFHNKVNSKLDVQSPYSFLKAKPLSGDSSSGEKKGSVKFLVTSIGVLVSGILGWQMLKEDLSLIGEEGAYPVTYMMMDMIKIMPELAQAISKDNLESTTENMQRFVDSLILKKKYREAGMVIAQHKSPGWNSEKNLKELSNKLFEVKEFMLAINTVLLMQDGLEKEKTLENLSYKLLEIKEFELAIRPALMMHDGPENEQLVNKIYTLISSSPYQDETMSTISNASPKIQGSQETIFIDQSTPNKVIATAQKIKAISSEVIGLIALEDGSHWDLRSLLSETDSEIFSNWRLGDLIVIFPNENFFSSRNYSLYNSTKKTSILANLYLGPQIGGAFTKKATEIDLVSGNITLSDGSSWLIADHFKETLKKWKIDDFIILGSGNKGNNILINVSLNSFVESK